MRSAFHIPQALLDALFKQWQSHPLTPEESSLIEDWLAQSPENRKVWEELQQPEELERNLHAFHHYNEEEVWEKINAIQENNLAETPAPESFSHKIRRLWPRYAAAAVIFALTLIGIQQINKNSPSVQPTELAEHAPEILPGMEGAVLQLADGTTMVLDSMGNGIVARPNGTEILLENGQLKYNAAGAGSATFNTILTPAGRQFRIALPDGSGVWLNAGSSLRFPTAFTGRTRDVTVTGEAYFEVARNEKMPFRVQMNNGARVEVLGTRFNVNTYDNEPAITTTLLEGSVRFSSHEQAVVMAPGQQAAVNREKGLSEIDLRTIPHPEQSVAWKEGVFSFSGTDLRNIMRQIERWYDVKVVFEGKLPPVRLTGEISRNVQLSEILDMFSYKEIPFRMEGKKLIIAPRE